MPADKAVQCRHCGKPFVPLPGKPGYINECPDCLYEKTVPFEPKGLAQRDAEQAKRTEDALVRWRRTLQLRHGLSKEQANQLLAKTIAENMKPLP